MVREVDLERYVETGGQHCPVCNAKELLVEQEFESDTKQGWRQVSCMKCRSKWYDVYEFILCEMIEDTSESDK